MKEYFSCSHLCKGSMRYLKLPVLSTFSALRLSFMETRRQRFPLVFWRGLRTSQMGNMLLLPGKENSFSIPCLVFLHLYCMCSEYGNTVHHQVCVTRKKYGKMSETWTVSVFSYNCYWIVTASWPCRSSKCP